VRLLANFFRRNEATPPLFPSIHTPLFKGLEFLPPLDRHLRFFFASAKAEPELSIFSLNSLGDSFFAPRDYRFCHFFFLCAMGTFPRSNRTVSPTNMRFLPFVAGGGVLILFVSSDASVLSFFREWLIDTPVSQTFVRDLLGLISPSF